MTAQEIYIQLRLKIQHDNVEPTGILVHPKVYADLEYEFFRMSTHNQVRPPLKMFGKEVLRSYDVGVNEVKFLI
jgi:hypothetical protein